MASDCRSSLAGSEYGLSTTNTVRTSYDGGVKLDCLGVFSWKVMAGGQYIQVVAARQTARLLTMSQGTSSPALVRTSSYSGEYGSGTVFGTNKTRTSSGGRACSSLYPYAYVESSKPARSCTVSMDMLRSFIERLELVDFDFGGISRCFDRSEENPILGLACGLRIINYLDPLRDRCVETTP